MKNGAAATAVVWFAVATLVAACVRQETRTLQSLDQPINCATAEGDIRALEDAKVSSTTEVVQSISALSPVGIVIGSATGAEGTKVEVGSGDYNRKIDDRIATIKYQCGVR